MSRSGTGKESASRKRVRGSEKEEEDFESLTRQSIGRRLAELAYELLYLSEALAVEEEGKEWEEEQEVGEAWGKEEEEEEEGEEEEEEEEEKEKKAKGRRARLAEGIIKGKPVPRKGGLAGLAGGPRIFTTLPDLGEKGPLRKRPRRTVVAIPYIWRS